MELGLVAKDAWRHQGTIRPMHEMSALDRYAKRFSSSEIHQCRFAMGSYSDRPNYPAFGKWLRDSHTTFNMWYHIQIRYLTSSEQQEDERHCNKPLARSILVCIAKIRITDPNLLMSWYQNWSNWIGLSTRPYRPTILERTEVSKEWMPLWRMFFGNLLMTPCMYSQITYRMSRLPAMPKRPLSFCVYVCPGFK